LVNVHFGTEHIGLDSLTAIMPHYCGIRVKGKH